MKINARWFAGLVAAWGLALALIGATAHGGGCSGIGCVACGACFRNRPAEEAANVRAYEIA